MKLNEITLRNTHLMFEEQYNGGNLMRFAPGVAQVGDDWHVFLPDEKAYVVAADQAEATRIQAAVDELVKGGKTPAVITSEISNKVNKPNGFRGTFQRQWNGISRAIKSLQFADIADRPWTYKKLGTLAATNTFKTISGLRRFVGPANFAIIGMSIGCMVEIDNIELEIQEGGDADGELLKLQNILVAQMVAYMTAGLIKVMATGGVRIIRHLLRGIKTLVRGTQVIALATPGAPVSLFSLIITESAWLVIPMIASMPAVQRYLAEFISNSMLGDFIADGGAAVVLAAESASSLLDGEYGTATIVNVLTGRNRGFEQREADGGPTGEYYGDSEWAKKVFGGLLFPPGQASILVPYINYNRRESLLNGTMRLNPIDADNTAPETSTDDTTDDTVDANGETVDANGETAADRGNRAREASLQTNYSNPNFTRAQPMNGPR